MNGFLSPVAWRYTVLLLDCCSIRYIIQMWKWIFWNLMIKTIKWGKGGLVTYIPKAFRDKVDFTSPCKENEDWFREGRTGWHVGKPNTKENKSGVISIRKKFTEDRIHKQHLWHQCIWSCSPLRKPLTSVVLPVAPVPVFFSVEIVLLILFYTINASVEKSYSKLVLLELKSKPTERFWYQKWLLWQNQTKISFLQFLLQ